MKITNKIASVFLAAVFLYSSLGFTISSMVCVKSGKGKVSLALIEDCCSKAEFVSEAKAPCCEDEQEAVHPDNMTVIKEGECCDINSYSFHLDDFQNAQKTSVDQVALFDSIFNSSPTFSSDAAEHKLSFQYADLPPPLYGRTLLNFISSLII